MSWAELKSDRTSTHAQGGHNFDDQENQPQDPEDDLDLADVLRFGDWIELRTPEGDFYYENIVEGSRSLSAQALRSRLLPSCPQSYISKCLFSIISEFESKLAVCYTRANPFSRFRSFL